MSKEDIEERRKKELEKLANEYETKRIQLELKKKILIKEYESKPENREELNRELNNIDSQIEENEELKKGEEKNINITLTKKIVGNEGEFIYEPWMDDILELHVIENCFDFGRAIPCIHSDFKNRNVKNLDIAFETAKRFVWDNTGVYLYGIAGQGKTHLLIAALRDCILHDKNVKLLRYSMELKNYRDLNLKKEDFFKEYSNCDYLFVDDFGSVGTKDDALDIL